jgi:dehydrogenase/reductase SDR family protein 7
MGKIDIIVLNAARSQRGLVERTVLSIDREIFDLNVIGTLSMTKAALPHMIERKSGHVVAISSVAGKMGAPVSGSYSATKHALQGFFNTLRYEVADRNITVSTVCPGPFVSMVEN